MTGLIEIKKGDFIGIYGESGSGKTTLINLVCGLLKLKEGSIEVDSKKIITVEENVKAGGFGSSILEASSELSNKIKKSDIKIMSLKNGSCLSLSQSNFATSSTRTLFG